MPTYYRNKETGKIEAKYVGCDTQSAVFRNTELYERFESKENLPLEVTPTPEEVVPTPVQAEPKLVEKKKPWWKRIF